MYFSCIFNPPIPYCKRHININKILLLTIQQILDLIIQTHLDRGRTDQHVQMVESLVMPSTSVMSSMAIHLVTSQNNVQISRVQQIHKALTRHSPVCYFRC